jgi:hypothetical protein
VPTFYRIVRTDPPTAADFMSNRDKGLPPRGPEVSDPDLWAGISVYDHRDRAESQARRYQLGAFLAVIELPDNRQPGGLRVSKTLTDPHHHTLWGAPDTLVTLVTRVVPL